MTEPGDLIWISDGRAVKAVDVRLDQWPRMDNDEGTVGFVAILTEQVRTPPLAPTDPRIGVNERILASLAQERRKVA
jgi:hypothetical protein